MLLTPKSAGGRGLPVNSAVSVALAEAERLGGEGDKAWAQAVPTGGRGGSSRDRDEPRAKATSTPLLNPLSRGLAGR